MAAVLAEGTTTLENAAREPEIVDLCKFLVSMGADIDGAGSSTVRINGVDGDAPGGAHGAGRPHRGRNLPHRRAPSRVVTWKSPASARTCSSCSSPSCASVGVQVQENTRSIRASGRSRARTRRSTWPRCPIPGFPTDLQAQMMVLLSIAQGRLGGHGERVREPLRLRRRAGPPGRGHPGGRQSRGRHRRAGAHRGHRALPRPAGRGGAGYWPGWSPRDAPNCGRSITSTGATSVSSRSCGPWAPRWRGWARARLLRLALTLAPGGVRARISSPLASGAHH